MKKKVLFLISVSAFHVVAVLFMLMGLFLFGKGCSNLQGMKNSVSLERLSIENLREGVYVEDDVYFLTGCYPDTGYGKIFSRMSSTQSAGGGLWYNIYTIPIGDKGNEHITVAVYENAESDKLWNNLTDKPAGTPVKLFGRISINKYSINEPWHMEAFGITDEELLRPMISYEFYIKTLDKEKESSLWYKGFSLLLTGAFIWFMCYRKWGKVFWLEIKKENSDGGNEKRTEKKNYR